MKNFLQLFFNLFNYNLIKSKNYRKIYRTLDYSIKSLIRKKNPVIIDVGAHYGESIKRFNKLFGSPEVHAFEPQTEAFEKLKEYKSENIHVNNYGLGSNKGKKNLIINSNTAASSYLKLDNNSKSFRSVESINKQETKLDTLDNYLIEKNIDFVDLVKIDVQGFENEVLKGSIKSLKRIYLIEIEIVFVDYYEKKGSFFQIENILKNFGFELYSLSSLSLIKKNDRLKNLDALYLNTKLSNKSSSN